MTVVHPLKKVFISFISHLFVFTFVGLSRFFVRVGFKIFVQLIDLVLNEHVEMSIKILLNFNAS